MGASSETSIASGDTSISPRKHTSVPTPTSIHYICLSWTTCCFLKQRFHKLMVSIILYYAQFQELPNSRLMDKITSVTPFCKQNM